MSGVSGDVNYFDLVERNNELVERLLCVLDTIEVPKDARPYMGHVVLQVMPCPNSAHYMYVQCTATREGMQVELNLDATRLWWKVFEWRDPEPV